MSSFKDTVLKGLYYEYLGLRQQTLAELNVLLENPVGVGDHAVQAKDVGEKIIEVERLNSLIDTLLEEFHDHIADPTPHIPDELMPVEGTSMGDYSQDGLQKPLGNLPEDGKAGGTPGPDDVVVDTDCCDDGKCGC